jgi:hypothetical protein
MADYFPKTYGNRNPYFEAMLKEGTNTSPIGAHSQGASRLAFALLAGFERGQMDRERRERAEQSQGKRELSGQQVDPAMPVSIPGDVTGSAETGAAAPAPSISSMPSVAGTPAIGSEAASSPAPYQGYPAVGGMRPAGRVRAGRRYTPSS